MRIIAIAAATALLASGAALAKMTIDETHYEAGVLVVRGKAAPGTDVVIDGLFTKKTDDDGVFIFRLNYKPENCRVRITAIDNDETRDVTNCATPADTRVVPKADPDMKLAPKQIPNNRP